MHTQKQALIELAHQRGVLKFGDFTLKSGRNSPYFFNAGLFCDSEAIALIADLYAQLLHQAGANMIFGPAYKGIPFVAATAAAMWRNHNKQVDWGFNRKEAKDHGEGGVLVGAPVAGRAVWVLDDVVTAGTAIREVEHILHKNGASIAGIVVLLDRKERGQGAHSAIDELQAKGITVHSLINLNDILSYLEMRGEYGSLEKMRAYRDAYGV